MIQLSYTSPEQREFEIKCMKMQNCYADSGRFLFLIIDKRATEDEIKRMFEYWLTANKLFSEIFKKYHSHLKKISEMEMNKFNDELDKIATSRYEHYETFIKELSERK